MYTNTLCTCTFVELTKTADEGKFGVGYFQPDDCDNVKTVCKYTPYPEYDNLKKAYTTTKNSTVTFDAFTPKRDKILTCPTAIKTDLPSTPKGKLSSSALCSYHLAQL